MLAHGDHRLRTASCAGLGWGGAGDAWEGVELACWVRVAVWVSDDDEVQARRGEARRDEVR